MLEPRLTTHQVQLLATLGFGHVIGPMSAGSHVSEGCGTGGHADVWKVARSSDHQLSDPAVAKFWTRRDARAQAPQERALQRAAAKHVSCMPRLLASGERCTIMTLCPGVTLKTFAKSVAQNPENYRQSRIERLLVGFVHAVHELHAAAIYHDDMHDDNVLVDYDRHTVWIIDPLTTTKRDADPGGRVVRILSRCIGFAANASPRLSPDESAWRVCWSAVSAASSTCSTQF